MQHCRDCGKPTAASARSCPSCGILNPVLQWVALPDGSHDSHREPVRPGGAANAFAIFDRNASPAAIAPQPTRTVQAVQHEEGLEAITLTARRFYIVAVLTGILGFMVRGDVPLWYLDPILLGGLAAALQHLHSRVAAGLLTAYAAFTVLSQVLALAAGEFNVVRLIIWCAITVMAFKAFQATLAIQKQRAAAAVA
ncbi:MAG TPA: hypothetical protein VF665_13830 [Longimicrobium sp.]|jgi:hypothetical protein|uniref:hypothetical protein n=1 Tax=Longimicrobium sp. TaxID=2029185 RepID=UPI002ED950E1